MAGKVRVEWVVLGLGAERDGEQPNIIRSVQGAPAILDVSGTATTAGSRPVAPAFTPAFGGGRLYARLIALAGNVVAAWGDDPTAAQNNGIVIRDGWPPELVPVAAGQKLSFIELALS